MVDIQFTPEQRHGTRTLRAAHAHHDHGLRSPKMVAAYVVVLIGLIIALQVWMNRPGDPAPDANPRAATTGSDNQPANLAPNGLPLPQPTRREIYEITDDEIESVKVRPARQVDLELIRVGEISRSESNPRVRINHTWHGIGDQVRGIEREYIVVRIETDRIFVQDENGNVREYYPGKLHGINTDLMAQYREHFFERHGIEPEPEEEEDPGPGE